MTIQLSQDTEARLGRAATELAARYASRSAGPTLPDDSKPADAAEALIIQQRVQALLGAQTGGWKCSLPAQGQPVLAPIYAERITQASQSTTCVSPAHDKVVEVEPEIAYVIGVDLPPRSAPYTPAEVLEAVASTHLALELIGSRYLDRKPETHACKLADRLANFGLFVGPAIDAAANHGDGLANIALTLAAADGTQGNWHGKHPDGHPLTTLHWLANYLAAHGNGLRRGAVVTTGSYQGVLRVPAATALRLQFGALGQIEVRIDAA